MASGNRTGSKTPTWLREPPDEATLRAARDALCRVSGRDPGRPPTAQEALDLGVAMSSSASRADAERGRNWLWVSASMGSQVAASELARHITETGPATPGAPPPLEMMALVGHWLRRATTPAPHRGANARISYEPVDTSIFAGFDEDDAQDPSAHGTVVAPFIGDALSKEGREIQKRYGHFIGVPLPTVGELPNPADLEVEFVQKFPWEPGLARWLKGQVALQRQAGRQGVVLPPLLLVGPSGSGKTTMLEWLVRRCRIPFQTIPIGGTNDAAGLGGGARVWLTSQPGAVTLMMAEHGCANPCIILDELDKGVADMSNRNGSVIGTLLALLQPPADGWRDPYLMAPVDLSQVMFMASANDLAPLPRTLRSRMTVRAVRAPGPEHFDALLPGVIESAAAHLGLSSDMMPWISVADREWMRSVFLGGGCNIRHLQQAYNILSGDKAAEEEMAMRRPH